MTANEKIKILLEKIQDCTAEIKSVRYEIIQISNACDWFGTKYQRDWLFKAEASVNESLRCMVAAWDDVEYMRADVAKREAKK